MNERYYPYETETGTIQLPSVTTLLGVANKEGLNIWRSKMGFELAEQTSEETASVGKEIHSFVSHLLQGMPISKLEWEQLDDQIKNGIRAFERFRVATGLVMADCEKVVYNLKYGYVGTLDFVGTAGGSGAIIDWKSGERFWPSHFAQVAAYYHALPQRRAIKWLYVVNLNRNSGIPIVNKLAVKDATPYWKYFLSCLSLFKNTKAIESLHAPNRGVKEAINGNGHKSSAIG